MLGQQSSHVGEKITQTSNSWILYWIIHWTRPQEILPKRPEKDLQSFIAPESVEKKNHNVSIKKKKKSCCLHKKMHRHKMVKYIMPDENMSYEAV